MRVIVVGAGFAGLAAADTLARAGAEVEVLEARDRVGGRVWSVPFAGAVVERGAEFILPHDRAVLAAADRLGLALVRKGTLYGNREPRGGPPVSGAEVLRAVQRLGSEPPAGTLAACARSSRARAGRRGGDRGAARGELRVSCRRPRRFRTDRGRGRVRRLRHLYRRRRQRPYRPGAGVWARRRRARVAPGVERVVARGLGFGDRGRGGGARRRRRDRGPGIGPRRHRVRPAAPAREGARALRPGREAVRRAPDAGATEPDALGAGAVLVLHPARAGRRAAAVRRRVRGLAGSARDRSRSPRARAGGSRHLVGCGRISTSTSGPFSCRRGQRIRGCRAPTRHARPRCRSTRNCSGARSGRSYSPANTPPAPGTD